MQTEEELLESYRRDGKLIIMATPRDGVNVGEWYASIVDLPEFVDLLDVVSSTRNMARTQTARAIAKYIRIVTQRPVGEYRPETDYDFLNDLAGLLACIIVTKDETLLTFAGLKTLKLSIGKDSSLPWNERGMLSPEIEKKFNIPVDAELISLSPKQKGE